MAEVGTYWQDTKHGAAKRSAHWLWTVVGEGQKFKKAQLRAAVPAREQVDRRMRDLRPVGWVIKTYRDMKGLAPDELYYEKTGDHVWEDGYKWPSGTISQRLRRQVYDRDGNRCVVCGIGAGEEYPDMPGVFARMTIGHLVPKGRKGKKDPSNYRTECSVCNEPTRHLGLPGVDLELLKDNIRELGRAERQRLYDWMSDGKRSFGEVDRIWLQYRQLPAPQRDEVRKLLDDLTK